MGHAWKFFRAGGFDQVQLNTGRDLVALDELDQKLWVALACPTKGLEFDPRTLELIDSDGDGRIHAVELIQAIKWAASLLKNVDDLAKGADSLPIAAIKDSTDEGKIIAQTARELVKSLGKPEADAVSIADTKDAIAAFAKRDWNGDGVVPEESLSDDETKAALRDVLACTTPATDKSGKPGITEKNIEAFWKEVDAFAAWLRASESDAAVLPFGADSEGAYAAYVAVRAKIDDYFARCRVAAFDARALAAVNREEKEYLELAAKDLHVTANEIAHFPIAQVAVDRPMPLERGVNPAWSDALATFTQKVVTPTLGAKTALTPTEWADIKKKMSAHEAWVGAKKGETVEKLGRERVLVLARSGVKAKLEEAVKTDKDVEPLANAITSVEKLVRYHRDLMKLANNFVSFRDFYGRRTMAIFQAGRLFLDTRECHLCVRVNDAGKHATMAPLAKTCLVYCDLKNSKGETMSIAAAMTAGDTDNLMVGRNGVFYDREGRDWDATVTKIVDNPISVKQAFWSPYKKALRLVEEQVAKRAADADTAANAKLTGAVESASAATSGTAPAAGAAPATTAGAPKPFDIGVVAALGVAVGGITAALGALLEAFFGLGIWMPLGVLGLILLISGPSMAIAWLKLRQRNLGPLLDANGWAVNAQAKINVPLGESLTREAKLPEGAARDLDDPYAESTPPWRLYLFLAFVLSMGLAWYLGKLDAMLPNSARSTSVLGENAPAAIEAREAAETAAPAPAPEAAPAS